MILRLNPLLDSGLTWFPAFRQRVMTFNQRYLSEMAPPQMATMAQNLLQRWVSDPISTGYWLGFKEGVPVAHVCGWMSVDWGQPYAFIYQADAPPGFTKGWSLQLDEWVAEMNGLLVSRGGAPISFVEFATFNDAAAMARLLEGAGRTNLRSRSILRFDI